MACQCSPSHLQFSFTLRRWLLWVALLAAASAGVMSRFVCRYGSFLYARASAGAYFQPCCTIHPTTGCAELRSAWKQFADTDQIIMFKAAEALQDLHRRRDERVAASVHMSAHT